MSDTQNVDLETPTNEYNSVESYSFYHTNKILIKESLFEFLGMYVFIVLSLGNVAIYALYPSAQLNWTGVSISWGLNLMFGIFMAGLKSPAHLNPAVSLSMYLFKKNISLTQLIAYSISQYLGALVAAANVYCIYFNNFGDNDMYSSVLTTYKNSSITVVSAFFTEFLGTTLLVCGIFMLIDNIHTKDHLPVYIGTWLSTLVFSFGYQTAFAWNPARDLGPRIVAAMVGYNSFTYIDHYFWVPFIASYTGGIFGAFIYQFVIKANL
jgi:MIP family channel proteins